MAAILPALARSRLPMSGNEALARAVREPAGAPGCGAATTRTLSAIVEASRSSYRGWRHDRLTLLLPISFVLHLVLIAWLHSAGGIGGNQRPSARDAALTATLTQPSARGTSIAARSAPLPQDPAPRHAALAAADAATPVPAQQAPASPALLPRTVYYPSDELTTRPVAQGEPELDPPELSTLIASGEVALTLWIDERGEVVELTVEHSDLPGAFVQAAATAFRALRFSAGEVDGRKVGSVLQVEVRYDDERLAGG